MKEMPGDCFGDYEDQGLTVAMDLDDVDQLDLFREGALAPDNQLADANFFNSFHDDFDDSDIN